MTLDEMLRVLRAPSDEAWRSLKAWLRALDPGAVSAALPELEEALAQWPESVLRSCDPSWVRDSREELLGLCRAPGGLILEIKGGGGDMARAHARVLVSVDKLGEAAPSLLGEVFDVSGDSGSSVAATPFRHGQVVGPAVDLAPHIEARHGTAATATTFRLDAIPEEVRESLRAHYERCVEKGREGQGGHRLVPLELRWDPRALAWPTLGGTGDWFCLERVVIHDGEAMVYDDGRAAFMEFATTEYWPEPPPELDEDELELILEGAGEETASIAKMLATQGLEELLMVMLRVLQRFGVWAPSNFDDAYDRTLAAMELMPKPDGRAERLCETLGEHGRLEGSALETVAGLLCCHAHDLGVFRAELKALRRGELLLLCEGGDIEALVPLCAWAVSAHRNIGAARGALADAILEHPFVDDLFCEDRALLAHRGQ